MEKLLVIGCGGHAKSVIDIIERQSKLHIYGLVGIPEEVGKLILGHQIIASDCDLPILKEKCPSAVLGIGQISDSRPRRRVAKILKELGFNMPTIVSPHSIVSQHATLGPGSVVCHGAIINAGAVIGSHCIINSGAVVEHDCYIQDHCHVSTGVLMNGGVRVGSGSFLGSGSIIREGIHLPMNTIVSAGKRVMGWPCKERP